MDIDDLDQLPGFRRRLIVSPQAGRVTAAVEDDYHCMAVTLRHEGGIVTAVEAVMDRAPWTTCPGAPMTLRTTFEGVGLADVAARGEKQANCTHLHDLAVLAAAHAGDVAATTYDILSCDPVDGSVAAEIRRDGTTVHRIAHRENVVTAPAEIAGTPLFKLRGWIESLHGLDREAARLLQWGAILAHGRMIPMERQSDANRMPPNCYTFQPHNRVRARRVGEVIDFTRVAAKPLEHLAGEGFRSRGSLA